MTISIARAAVATVWPELLAPPVSPTQAPRVEILMMRISGILPAMLAIAACARVDDSVWPTILLGFYVGAGRRVLQIRSDDPAYGLSRATTTITIRLEGDRRHPADLHRSARRSNTSTSASRATAIRPQQRQRQRFRLTPARAGVVRRGLSAAADTVYRYLRQSRRRATANRRHHHHLELPCAGAHCPGSAHLFPPQRDRQQVRLRRGSAVQMSVGLRIVAPSTSASARNSAIPTP